MLPENKVSSLWLCSDLSFMCMLWVAVWIFSFLIVTRGIALLWHSFSYGSCLASFGTFLTLTNFMFLCEDALSFCALVCKRNVKVSWNEADRFLYWLDGPMKLNILKMKEDMIIMSWFRMKFWTPQIVNKLLAARIYMNSFGIYYN